MPLGKTQSKPRYSLVGSWNSKNWRRNKQKKGIMKRYGYLYEDVYDLDNIKLAHRNAQKGKSHYKEVKRVNEDPEKYYQKVHEMLKNKTFTNSEYEVMTKKTDSGKVREIYKLPYYPDRIIHHSIVQVVGQIWIKTLIKNTYACIPGRGIHKCAKHIKKDLKDEKKTRYCLKMDVKKYYPSVDHEVLKRIIRKKIKDPNLLWLLDEIIDSAPGIPIGNYLSQYFGNLYLSGYDHYMKEVEKCKNYYRYCDDIVILGSSKSWLHKIREKTEEYLEKLKLKLKGNYQVFPVDDRGIDFLGYRFFHGYTLLRKSIAKKFKKRVKQIKKHWRKMGFEQVVNSIMSYVGWFKHANCHNLFQEYIDDKVFWIVKQKCRQAGIDNPLQGEIV